MKVKLTKREKEVMTYVEKGHSNKEVAEKLFVGVKTVDFHLSNIYKKLKVSNRVKAINKIKDLGISLNK